MSTEAKYIAYINKSFHATRLFGDFLMFSGGIERDQWHKMG